MLVKGGNTRPLSESGRPAPVGDAMYDAPHGPIGSEERLRSGARALGNFLHPDRVIEQAVRHPVPEAADLCALFLAGPDGSVHWWCAFQDEPGRCRVSTGQGTWSAETVASAPWLDEILRGTACEGEPAPGDPVETLIRTFLPLRNGPRAFRAVAVPGLTEVAGALLLHRSSGALDVSPGTARDYAEGLGTSLSTARLYQHQARTASTLMSALVPAPLPEVEHAELGAVFRSSVEAERIGGDFYGVHPCQDGFDLAFGDVCGKGNDAALLSGMLRQSLEALRLVEQDPRTLLSLLNVLMLRTDPEKFSTVLLGRAEPARGGALSLRLAGGGHPAPLVVGPDGAVRDVRVGGLFVGAIEEAVFKSTDLVLEPGESLVFYSDGVTEARNPLRGGEMLGEERLRHLLRECGGASAHATAEWVAQRVGDWLGDGEHDDITVLTVRPRGPDRGSGRG
ncbi:PP2C family protein-serine/threonine phosphatase [Nocardiopsis salina]|uniref:PP2C family protein-serine/threonine phosphatase n=1 Tax=Nocardiopsis salina TaxID=245836 RepID=UPI00034BBC67|nr:PP2C family protein-serine/threonine phosphatase [Nocardiopsis salina]